MFPITDGEREELRRAAEQTLFELCTIYSSSSSYQDEYGQTHQAFTEISDVPCGVAPAGESQSEREQPIVLTGDAVLRVRLDQSISVLDYVVVRGKSYQVDGVFDGLTVRRAALKISALPEGA